MDTDIQGRWHVKRETEIGVMYQRGRGPGVVGNPRSYEKGMEQIDPPPDPESATLTTP